MIIYLHIIYKKIGKGTMWASSPTMLVDFNLFVTKIAEGLSKIDMHQIF